jgi:hypothetical protein
LKKPAKVNPKEFMEYWKPLLDAFISKKESEKGSLVKKRALELNTKVSEALQKCKRVADLPACAEDLKRMLNFSLENLGVKPENVTLMAT